MEVAGIGLAMCLRVLRQISQCVAMVYLCGSVILLLDSLKPLVMGAQEVAEEMSQWLTRLPMQACRPVYRSQPLPPPKKLGVVGCTNHSIRGQRWANPGDSMTNSLAEVSTFWFSEKACLKAIRQGAVYLTAS